MTKTELDNYLAASKWTFAKTMAKIPHEWLARNEKTSSPADNAAFTAAVVALRQHATPKAFGRKQYLYYIAPSGFQYWTMGAPPEETTIINRAIDHKCYDGTAAAYAEAFHTQEDEEEESLLAGKLKRHLLDGSILDIGCGAGLLLNLLHIEPNEYVGIDPSPAMLAEFKKRHTGYTTRLEAFETFASIHDYCPPRFDNAVCLYGSLNYALPSSIPKVPKMIREGGALFLMFTKPDYIEIESEKRLGVKLPHVTHSKEFIMNALQCEPLDFGNYWIFAR
jgi:SAM-dependent methyltransferase